MDRERAEPNRLRDGVSRPNTLGRDPAVSNSRPGSLQDVRSTGGGRSNGGRRPADRQPFGPNSDAVVALLRSLDRFQPAEAQRLTSFWKAERQSDRDRAHLAAQAAADANGRRKAARAAQEEALHWLDAPPAIGSTWGAGGEISPSARTWAQLQREAFPAVLDAIAAVVLGDVLEPWAVEVLLGPWRQVVGPAD